MSEPAAPLPDDLALCHEIIRQQADTIRESRRRIAQLEHQVEQLLRRQYGPRRESVDPAQLRLFTDDAPDDGSEATTEEPPGPDVAKPRRHWRRRGRQRLPEGLPRKRVEYELSPEELPCPDCGHPRPKIGEEVSEQLEYVPSSLFVIQHVRCRYACAACQEHVAIADKPPQPIDKGLPGAGLLAQTITSKYSDHLPLYRLEDIFARHGVALPRATLCGGMASCAELLTPLYDLMVKRVLLSTVVHTDDTPVPVWDPTLPQTRTGRFWVYVGDVRNPYVVYDYTPRRTRDGPEQFLKGFRGYLQADASSGYDRICAGPDVIEVACWAHVRRKFFEARASAPVLAPEALARIRQLYAVEHAAEDLSAEEECASTHAIPRAGGPMNTPKPDKTIDELFAEFLTDQEARLSPKTYDKYQGIIDLYRSYLERYWPGHSGKEYDAITKTQATYCGTFGAEDITSGSSEFLGYFMPRKVIAGNATMKVAGTVVKKLARWLVEKGYTEDDESIRELVGEAARDLPASQKLLDDLYDCLSETGPVKSGRQIEGHFLIQRIGPRQIWLESMIPGDPEIGPIPVPAKVARACKVGWDVGGVVALTNKGWRLVEVWTISP